MTTQGSRRVGTVLKVALAIGVLIVAQRTGLLSAIVELWDEILYLSQQHILLVAISGGFAILTGIPIGVWLSRPGMRGKAEVLMQVLNVGTTIPTLAVLALSMSFLGIGTPPALFGLWVASVLPIVRNTYVGLIAVPGHLIEAATGMGMQPKQILWRIELPNALYVIFGGVRTALAINVGTAPLAFLIGAGGLGELIFTGIDLGQTTMMLTGALAVGLIALGTDFSLAKAQFRLVPRGVNPNR